MNQVLFVDGFNIRTNPIWQSTAIFEKSIILYYLSNGLTARHEICHKDAHWLFEPQRL